MLDAEEYRARVKAHLPGGAFLRLDRGEALFVSDAPRFGVFDVEIEGFATETKGELTFITPLYSDAPDGIRPIMTALIKADGDKRERLIRQNLAVCMRKKDAQGRAFLEKLLKEEDEHEA